MPVGFEILIIIIIIVVLFFGVKKIPELRLEILRKGNNRV